MNGRLVTASFGPPPICNPDRSIFNSGKLRGTSPVVGSGVGFGGGGSDPPAEGSEDRAAAGVSPATMFARLEDGAGSAAGSFGLGRASAPDEHPTNPSATMTGSRRVLLDCMTPLLGASGENGKFSPHGGRDPADNRDQSMQRFGIENRTMRRFLAIARILYLTAGVHLLGCGKEQASAERAALPKNQFSKTAPSVATLLAARPTSSAPLTSRELEEPPEQAGSAKQSTKSPPRIGNHRLVLDDLVDVAPAGPSAATSVGVLLLTREGRALIASLRPSPSRSARPSATPISPLEVASTDLVALERGPAVAAGFAYFVHGGHLVRKKLPYGEVENLADDARSYTRVALPDLPLGGAPAVAAYVARQPTDSTKLGTRLWVEGQGSLELTSDGSTGNSVALARANDGYLAVSLESRTGMSPLHVRRVAFDGGKVTLGADVVPWVAGTAQPLTEVFAIGDPTSVWALIPVERDATHFGLARVALGLSPRMGAEVHWREYPNGIDPAVVTSGYLCDRPVVLYARPATAEPHATQELHLASVGSEGLSSSTVVATSRAFADTSVAALDDGALVVYVADRRTWARRLRCLP
jgi:hypothetical protein